MNLHIFRSLRLLLPVLLFGTFLLFSLVSLTLAYLEYHNDMMSATEERLRGHLANLVLRTETLLVDNPDSLRREVMMLPVVRRDIAAVAITDAAGSILFAHRVDWNGQALDLMAGGINPKAFLKSGERNQLFWHAGNRRLGALASYQQPLGASELVSQGRGVIYLEMDISLNLAGNFHHLLVNHIGILLAGIVLALALFFWLRHALILPATRLIDYASRLGRNHFEPPPPPSGCLELHELGEAIGGMSTRLQDYMASLQESEARYRNLFENSHSTMLIIDPQDGRIVDANPAASLFYGWSRETLLDMHIQQINTLSPKENREGTHGGNTHDRNTGYFRHRIANGDIRDVEVFSGPIHLGGRELLYSIVLDITRRIEMEADQALQRRRAEALLELPHAADQMSEADFMRFGMEQIENLTGSRIAFIHFVNNDEQTIELITWSKRTLEHYCHAVFDRHYPVDQAGIWADALRKRQPVVFNDYAGYPHKRGLPQGHAELNRLISLPVMERDKVVMLCGIGNKDEHYTDTDVETAQLVANDIWRIVQRQRAERETELAMQQQVELNKKLEDAGNQLLQSEKLASIGQLAAGVAHEINNPIGFVSSNLGTLESYLKDLFAIADAYAVVDESFSQEEVFKAVRQLKTNSDYDYLRSDTFALLAETKEGLARIAKIVRDLKDFSRAGDATFKWADLHAGLESTLNIVWNELKYKCTVTKHYGTLPEVWCVLSQLNQVFMNLLVNAAHAIPEKGEITITTGQQGDKVFIAIQDTGNGIAQENLNRIFDPFFTTKPVGQGTGLGLSLAWSIVQKHGGRIEVASTVGQGSTFTVWLPIAPAKSETAP